MIGEMMNGMPRQGEPDLETQWSQTLKKPEIQAALLNFGVELMKPRWSSASALPDALSAGARGFAGVQEEQFNRQQQEAAVARAQSEKSADRDTRLEAARLAADSRAEVANIRTAGMLEGIRSREELKRSLTGGFTPQENARYNTLVRMMSDQRKNDLTRMGQPVDEKKLAEEVAATARNIVLGERVGALGGTGGGNIPSANSSNGGAPVGPPGAAPAAKIPSANSSSTTPAKPTVKDVIRKLESAGRWTGSAAQIQAWKALVSDPENFDKLTMPQRGGTSDVLRKMYEGQ